ncbi:glycosyltransferase family 2 protein [Pedobacter flavus]|uniref:Glycosyltransferase family 2 protein n=1 Tax=Pedobacter flavus TaxID=3113906 RepID=A0ABU7H2Y7_9SPHI|nr:glycosyltransferase family 2 protein [Pedobacter sp. VNH31]MEE1885606.1 glycosyltransferase family 2 protein [Pedobacter sp. VNH31]
MVEPLVAVVILNWNGQLLLQKFLPSVVNSTYKNLKIVVGDNASTDDSVAFVKENYPFIDLVVNDKNYGFAEGYNRVLNEVEADYYILLNSDVEVSHNWIEPLVELLESDKSIGAAQPILRSYTDRNHFEYAGAAGGFMDAYGYPFCRGRIFDTCEEDKGQYVQPIEIFWASGAALCIKKSAWINSGGFDADLFAHMEEIDLCWRLKNLDYKIMSCPSSVVYHVGGATLTTSNPYKTYLNFRNNLIILQKNLPSSEATKVIFVRFILDFIAWLKFLFTGKIRHTVAISRAHFNFLRTISSNKLKRTQLVKPFHQHTGIYKKSIVYAYFINKIKKFNNLDKNYLQ